MFQSGYTIFKDGEEKMYLKTYIEKILEKKHRNFNSGITSGNWFFFMFYRYFTGSSRSD